MQYTGNSIVKKWKSNTIQINKFSTENIYLKKKSKTNKIKPEARLWSLALNSFEYDKAQISRLIIFYIESSSH